MTLHDAIEQAPPGVADLLAQLAVADSEEDPDDVLRRLLDRAASAELAQLRRHARASVGMGSTASADELAALSERAAGLQRALSRLRATEPGVVAGGPMTGAEAELLALLVGSPSVSPGPAA